MKKLFTVTLLAGLLSIPSMVFAEASWYGSIRAGVASTPHDNDDTDTIKNNGSSTGVSDNGSRWGIKGSSEVSEGLTAVYRWETKIDSTSASQTGGRLSYVGLSGGFGTITVGQVWSASYNSAGAMTDNSFAYGSSETSYRVGDAVSYAVSMGNLSLQVDAIMDGDTKKTGDSFQAGATIGGLMETGSIAIAHISKADDSTPTEKEGAGSAPLGVVKGSSNFLVGQYGIGGMTMYLGAGKHTYKNDGCGTDGAQRAAGACYTKRSDTTTFAGIRGGVGDTGVSYVFQMRKKTMKATDNQDPVVTTKKSLSPWILGISRSLGGGASVHFETGDPDEDGISNSTGVWLKVDF